MYPDNDLWRYVYLNSLKRDSKPYANARLNDVLTPFNYSMNDSGKAIEPLVTATKLLKRIAASEAIKERQAITNYLKKIQVYENDESLPQQLRNSFKKQREQLTKSLDNNGLILDDFSLINDINIIRQNINTYQRRLKEITKQSDIKVSDRFEFRIQESLENFFRNQTEVGAAGIKSKNTKEDISRDRILKKQLTKIISSNKILQSMPQELQNEILALLFIDFNNWVENISSYNKSYKTISTKQFGHEIKQLVEEYASKSESINEQTHLQKIFNSSVVETIKLIQDMNNMWHSNYFSQNEIMDMKLRKILAEEENNKNKKSKINSIITSSGVTYSFKQVEDIYSTYLANINSIDDNRFTFTLHTKTSHGNFYEFIQTIISSAINIKGNVAADLFAPVGTVTVTYNDNLQQKELMKLSETSSKILTEAFNTEEKRQLKDFDQMITDQRNVTQTLQQELEKSIEKIKKISDETDQFFIAHESLKLYSQVENNSKNQFHGRNMNLMSALAKLYASPEIADAIIGREQLITYLINLDPLSLGSKNKKPLETYLSLFAGLLMFDDLNELSTSFVEQIENETAGQTINYLHIYNINGIYFPISIILNNLINALDSAINMLNIDFSHTFSLKINVDKHLKQPKKGESKESDWNALASQAMSNVKIKIMFFKGFVDYISNILTQFNT